MITVLLSLYRTFADVNTLFPRLLYLFLAKLSMTIWPEVSIHMLGSHVLCEKSWRESFGAHQRRVELQQGTAVISAIVTHGFKFPRVPSWLLSRSSLACPSLLQHCSMFMLFGCLARILFGLVFCSL